MAESPTKLTYPTATSADQLNNGASFSTTTNTWVPSTGAVTLVASSGITRDMGNQYECQLPDGTGLADTTYTLTTAQVQAVR